MMNKYLLKYSQTVSIQRSLLGDALDQGVVLGMLPPSCGELNYCWLLNTNMQWAEFIIHRLTFYIIGTLYDISLTTQEKVVILCILILSESYSES